MHLKMKKKGKRMFKNMKKWASLALASVLVCGMMVQICVNCLLTQLKI